MELRCKPDAVLRVSVLTSMLLACAVAGVDAQSVQTTLVTRERGTNNTMPGGATTVGLSADGNYALFQHEASVFATDQNNATDTFVFSLATGVATLVSGAFGSTDITANGASPASAISGNGDYVLFGSSASNLLEGFADGNASDEQDVFLFHRPSRAVTLVSRAPASATTSADEASRGIAVSPDGRFVLFASRATNLVSGVVDQNAADDVFVFDRETSATTLISRTAEAAGATPNSGSTPLGISSDGNVVLYKSSATDICAGIADSNGGDDLFLFDRAAGVSTLVTRAFGLPRTGNGRTPEGLLSADGSVVALTTLASNLMEQLLPFGFGATAYLFDRASSVLTLASRSLGSPTTAANHDSHVAAISANGERLLFHSFANDFFPGVAGGGWSFDVLVFDLPTGTTTLISRALGSATQGADGMSYSVAMSADGNRIAYTSAARNLVRGTNDTNGSLDDVFIFDRDHEMAGLLSRAAGSATTTSNHRSTGVAMSADGSKVLFSSAATNVVPGIVDVNGNFSEAFLATVGPTPTQVVFSNNFE